MCLEKQIHAVRQKKLRMTGIHFFEPGSFGGFSTKQPMSVLFREEEEGIWELSFADPTQSAAFLELETSLPVAEVLQKDAEIMVLEKQGKAKFTVRLEESPCTAAGKSYGIKVRTKI